MGQQHPEIDVQVVRWEKITFAEKLATFRDMAVQVSGVGTAQNNAFLLPAGAVHVSLGWRHSEAKCRIHYFDSSEPTAGTTLLPRTARLPRQPFFSGVPVGMAPA